MLLLGEPGGLKILRMKEKRRIKWLTRVLLNKTYGTARVEAARALGHIGDGRAAGPLCSVLTDEKASLRQAAMTALLTTADQRAVEPLCSVLTTLEPPMRRMAIALLGWLGSPQAVETLRVLLHNDADEASRMAAIDSLGKIGSPRAVAALCGILEDGSATEQMRSAADAALGLTGAPCIVELFCNSKVSSANVLRSLRQINDVRVVDRLCETLCQGPFSEICLAIEALGSLDYHGAIIAATTGSAVSADLFPVRMAEYLAIEYHAVDALCRVLDEPPIHESQPVSSITRSFEAKQRLLIRLTAVQALGKIRNTRALNTLRSINDANPSLREAIAQAIKVINQANDLRSPEQRRIQR